MDGSLGQRETKGSHQSPYPRASSRSSTATSSSSHTHRYHHSHCNNSTTSTAPPVSNLLQERLQKSRKAESSRSASRMGGDMSASTGDIRAGERDVQSSPVRRCTTAMARRARSNSGGEAGDKGIGVKEMEQMLSTLHKQNFDLKLELFHRRERQTELEEKAQQLELERAEMLDLHDNLLVELESRDKAVGEAVGMIIALEERVEALVREREMVRIVEADGSYNHANSDRANVSAAGSITPKMDDLPVPQVVDHAKTLDRMPSFLSERSERTQNLRNVVMGNRSSLLHTRNISGSSVDPSESNRIASPSLSVLSESSFMSIYGNKNTEGIQTPVQLPQKPQPVPSNDTLNNSSTPGKKLSNDAQGSQTGRNTSDRMPKDTSRGGVSLFSQIQSLNDILDINSPLRQLELLEKKLSVEDTSGQSTSTQGKGHGTSTPSPGRARPVPQVRTKQEKREALRKVVTSAPDDRDLANPHTLPPTPDTISTSTLRRYQYSNDTLSKEPRLTPQESFQMDNSSIATRSLRPQISPNLSTKSPSQPASTTAFTSRKELPITNLNTDLFANFTQLAQNLPRRPRSADDTTISRPRANSWVSDSDSDGGVDANSEDSDFDYWMRESVKPDSDDRRKYTHATNIRSASPDLFSFPDGEHGWETDALFGAMRGSGFLGSPASALKRDPLDEVAAMLPTRQAALFQPPEPMMPDGGVQPPNRRSSLHARTGSMSSNIIPPVRGKLRKSPTRSDSASRATTRARSNSIDSAVAPPPPKMQLHVQTDGPHATKRNHYPPISGQQTRSKGPGGLYGLFRRSGSESRSVPASATESSFPPEQFQQVQQTPQSRLHQEMAAGRSSVPPPASMSWAAGPLAVYDDDLTSATPPPIMRNRAPLHGNQAGPDGAVSDGLVTPRDGAPDASTPDTAVGPVANSTPQGIGKRKWLGLGRRGSLKNRTG